MNSDVPSGQYHHQNTALDLLFLLTELVFHRGISKLTKKPRNLSILAGSIHHFPPLDRADSKDGGVGVVISLVDEEKTVWDVWGLLMRRAVWCKVPRAGNQHLLGKKFGC